MKVRDLFGEKIRPVYTIASNRSIDDAVNLMVGKKTSALIVTEDDQPVGIFAERDVFRSYLRDKTRALSEIAMRDAMTDNLIFADPEAEISRIMAIMIKADIKHLPILENKKIAGMLTLSDLIHHQVESLTEEIHQLQEYLDDLHEAGRD